MVQKPLTPQHLERARLFRLEFSKKQVQMVEEAMAKNAGYALTNGKNDLRRYKQQVRFWSNPDRVAVWAAQVNYQPQFPEEQDGR